VGGLAVSAVASKKCPRIRWPFPAPCGSVCGVSYGNLPPLPPEKPDWVKLTVHVRPKFKQLVERLLPHRQFSPWAAKVLAAASEALIEERLQQFERSHQLQQRVERLAAHGSNDAPPCFAAGLRDGTQRREVSSSSGDGRRNRNQGSPAGVRDSGEASAAQAPQRTAAAQAARKGFATGREARAATYTATRAGSRAATGSRA
jgi:hypothetical protein